MDEVDWNGVFFGLGFLVLATVVLVVVLIQLGAFSKARISRRQEDEFRALSERYEALAVASTDTQQTAAAELTAIRGRLDEIERMLREVE